MAKYTKDNYDLSNKIYMGTGLIQMMALTNQTDQMLYNYFSQNNDNVISFESKNQTGFVRTVIEKAFTAIFDIKKMENEYPDIFPSIETVISFDCSRLYIDMDDYFIEKMVRDYPDANYHDLFTNYCKTFQPLGIYSNHELHLMYMGYQMSKLLDMFVDNKYSTFYKINNSEYIYQLYCEIIILTGPVRFFIYGFIADTIIKKLIHRFVNIIITFLVFNFVYETIILFFVKIAVITKIIKAFKEIVKLSTVLECSL